MRNAVLVVLACLALAGCGGGGGVPSEPFGAGERQFPWNYYYPVEVDTGIATVTVDVPVEEMP